MKKPIFISDYLPIQIKKEEHYYQELNILASGLITYLFGIIENNPRINISKLNTQYRSWLYNINQSLFTLAKNQAFQIVYLVDSVTPNKHIKTRKILDDLTTQIETVQHNLFNSIWAQFIVLIPIGVSGLYDTFFTNDSTKDDLYKRANNYVKRTCVNVYGQGTFNTMILSAKLDGYSQYLGDNRHDDRVREMHRKYFNGKIWIDFDNPPPCGHISTEWGCRCRIIAFK